MQGDHVLLEEGKGRRGGAVHGQELHGARGRGRDSGEEGVLGRAPDGGQVLPGQGLHVPPPGRHHHPALPRGQGLGRSPEGEGKLVPLPRAEAQELRVSEGGARLGDPREPHLFRNDPRRVPRERLRGLRREDEVLGFHAVPEMHLGREGLLPGEEPGRLRARICKLRRALFGLPAQLPERGRRHRDDGEGRRPFSWQARSVLGEGAREGRRRLRVKRRECEFFSSSRALPVSSRVALGSGAQPNEERSKNAQVSLFLSCVYM
mmetsp:Transcript_8166/g.23340  ORF Transcript_8166/g.23340 Transcript_8166/m.23340 type:complete len:263 (+) Transcript_8166:789-1577(+)